MTRPRCRCFRPTLESLEARVLPSANPTAVEVVTGMMNVYRFLVDPVRTGGLPVNEVSHAELVAGTQPTDSYFWVPAMLGNYLAIGALSNAYRHQDATFTAGYSDAELLTTFAATETSLEHILSTPGFTYVDTNPASPTFGKQALFQFHITTAAGDPEEGAPLDPNVGDGSFSRIVSGLDNEQLIAGLTFADQYLRSLTRQELDPAIPLARVTALADRMSASLTHFDLRMWFNSADDHFFQGLPDDPHGGSDDDRITREGRLAFVTALARGEITQAEFQAGVTSVDTASTEGASSFDTSATPAVVERRSFFGTNLEMYAIAPFVTEEQLGPYGEGTLYPEVQALKVSANGLGLPAGGAAAVSSGFTFQGFAMSPAENESGDTFGHQVLIPPAVGEMAGATFVAPLPSLQPFGDLAIQQLTDAVNALKAQAAATTDPVAKHWDTNPDGSVRYGAPNYLNVADTTIINGNPIVDDTDPRYGFLEIGEMGLGLLNGLMGGTYIEDTLITDPGWFNAARQYQEVLNVREVEWEPTGAGHQAFESNAGGGLTWRIETDGTSGTFDPTHPLAVTSPFLVGEPGDYSLVLRYSDNASPKHVEVMVNGTPVGSFDTVNTGDWNTFADSSPIELGSLTPGEIAVTFQVDDVPGTDQFGIELDNYTLTRHDLAVNNVNVVQSATTAGQLVFDVSLTSPLSTPVTVNYTTTPGTGTPGIDYAATSGTLTFNPGDTSQTVVVTIPADARPKGTETFFLDLSGATGGVTVSQPRGTASVITDNPATITPSAGSAQDAPVNTTFATALTAVVRDAFGNPVAGVPVTFAAPGTGASGTFAASATVTTDGNGVATAPAFTANTTAGSFVVTASVGVLPPADFDLTNDPAATSGLLITYQSPTVAAGAATSFEVTAVDAFGNTTPNYGGTIAFASTDGQAMLPPAYPFTVADAGQHSFNATLKTAGLQSITASDAADSSITSGPATITVTAAGATHLVLGQQPTTTVVAAPFYPAMTVLLEDPFNNVTADSSTVVTIALVNNSVHAILSGTTQVKAVNGIATFGSTAVSLAGTGFTLMAAANALPVVVSSPFDVVPVTHFSIRVIAPSGNKAGSTFGLTVTALDSANRPVAGYRGTVHFSSTDTQADLPADYTYTAGDNGQHTFNAVFKTAGVPMLTVSDRAKSAVKGVSAVGVSAVTVAPAATVALAVTGFPSPTLASAPHMFTVAAVDAFGNRTPAYRGRVHFSSLDVAAGLPADYTFTSSAAGAHTFTATMRTLGSQPLTASDLANGSITGTETISVASLGAGISGPGAGVRGQPLNYVLSASETGEPASTLFTFRIDWDGNGTIDQTVTGPSGMIVSDIFSVSKTYTIKVTAADSVGNTSIAPAATVTIAAIGLQTDPHDSALTALVIGGTTGADTITVLPTNAAGTSVSVTINGSLQPGGPFMPTGHIIIYGQAGNDIMQVLTASVGGNQVSVAVPAVLSGDAGNDVLRVSGTTSGNILLGGAGNDNLTGSSGRNLLIGGLGADTLHGGTDDDIVIGNATVHDGDLVALCAVMTEWDRTDADIVTRVGHLSGSTPGGLNGAIFLDATAFLPDVASDQLFGGGGLDWFVVTASGKAVDTANDVQAGDVVTAL
jgi:hypothetical protein